ncbi:MAG: hypothetical protein ACXW0Q_13775 [Methylovulum sp.]
MNKDRIEEYLVESLSKLEGARDHAASAGANETYNRLNDLCVNVSDLLDEIEDDQLTVKNRPQYSVEQAQLLYDVLLKHDAATLKPELNEEGRERLNEALANLRMELVSFVAERYVETTDKEVNAENYDYDDPVDGQ